MHMHTGLLPQTIAEAQKKNLILKDYIVFFQLVEKCFDILKMKLEHKNI